MEQAILEQNGAQAPAPDKFTSLATIRFIGGLQKQRSPFAGIDTRSGIKFYGGKPDALINGRNVEISNNLTLQRRPGLLAYGVSNIPSPTFFYDWQLATTQDIVLVIDTETSGGDNSAGANGAVFNYSPTHSGIYVNKAALSQQTNFTSVVNTLYMGDGVDLLKIVGPNLLTQSNTFGTGAGTSFGILAPWTEANIFALTGGQTDPLGTSTATQIIWGTTGAGAFIQQIANGGDGITGTNTTPNYTPVANNTFTFSVWMKQTGGAETVTISIRDQAGTIASQVCVLTTSWVKYQVTGTMGGGSTQVIARIGSPTTTNAMAIYGTQLEVGGPATTTQITTTKPQGVYLWGITAPLTAPTFSTTAQTGSTGKPWQSNFAYTLGQTIVDTNGNVQKVTTPGTSGGVAPIWNISPGSTTSDGQQGLVLQSRSASAASATTLTFSLTANVTAGSALAMLIFTSNQTDSESSGVNPTVTDTQTNSWVNKSHQLFFTFYADVFIVSSAAAGATAITVTLNGPSRNFFVQVVEVSEQTGLDASAPATNKASGSATPFFATGGFSNATAQDVILSFFIGESATSGGNVGNTPPGYTNIVSDQNLTTTNVNGQNAFVNMAIAIELVTMAGFQNPQWSITNPTQNSLFFGTTLGLKTSAGSLVWTNEGTVGGGLTTTLGYQWYYAFFNSYTGHFSNVSPISGNTGVITGQIVSVTGATRVMSNSGAYAADPQSDGIGLFRNTDGGQFFFLEALFGNGSAAQAALVAANYPGLTTTNVTYGSGTWSYSDSVPDSALNTAVFAPIGLLNSPPPAGLKNMDYFAGRMWGSVKNLLYYNTSADNASLLNVKQNGVPSESWIGDNVIPFNSAITRILATGGGLMVSTVTDIWFVTGQSVVQGGFNPQKILIGHGLRSYNALTVDGSTIYIYTSDRELLTLNPNSGSVEVGYPVGNLFELTIDPTSCYLARHVSGSRDNAMYFANTTSWYRLNPNQVGASIAGEATPVWSPLADFSTTIGGLGAIGSIETAAGVTKLLVGLPPNNTSGVPQAGPVLVRDLATFTDLGVAYTWSATIGSIMLATPGKLAEVDSITTEMNNSGVVDGINYTSTQCAINVLLDEIAGVPEPLTNNCQDPPGQAATVTVRGRRFYLSNDGGFCPACRHIQVNVTGTAVATMDEMLGITVRGALVLEQS